VCVCVHESWPEPLHGICSQCARHNPIKSTVVHGAVANARFVVLAVAIAWVVVFAVSIA